MNRTSFLALGPLFGIVLAAGCGGQDTSGENLRSSDAGMPPSIVAQPINQIVHAPGTASFSVVVEGSPPLTYQWKKNGTDIAGATSASYTTPATTSADNGAGFTVVARNSAGTATSNPATLTVEPPLPSGFYAYVAIEADNQLSAYSVNRTTGALSALSPATYSTSNQPNGVATAQGKFLYVGAPTKVDAFRVDLATGALAAIAGSPYSVASSGGSGIAVSPDGNFLYVGGSTQVYSFQIHSDGTLTAVAGSPFTTSGHSIHRLSTAGNFLFGTSGSTVLVFRAAAGVLTAPDAQNQAQEVYDFVATPDGHYAYGADYYAAVKAYTVDPVTGLMTVQAGTYTAETGFSTRGAVVSPNGRQFYALNRGGDVTQFNIAANGSLSPNNGTIVNTGLNENFEHIVMDPEGKFVYLTNYSTPPHNFVLGFTVDATTGALTQMPSATLAGAHEQGMAFIRVP